MALEQSPAAKGVSPRRMSIKSVAKKRETIKARRASISMAPRAIFQSPINTAKLQSVDAQANKVEGKECSADPSPPNVVTPQTESATPGWAYSRTTASESEHPHTIFEIDQRRGGQPRPLQFVDQSGTRQDPEESDSSNSDYSQDRATSEDLRIEKGKLVASQNSSYYAEFYKVGNPYAESSQKGYIATEAASLSSIIPQSVPGTYPTQESPSSDPSVPARFNFWQDPPEDKKKVWDDSERNLSGVGASVQDLNLGSFSFVGAHYDHDTATDQESLSHTPPCRGGENTGSFSTYQTRTPLPEEPRKTTSGHRRVKERPTCQEQFSRGGYYYGQRDPLPTVISRRVDLEPFGRARGYLISTPTRSRHRHLTPIGRHASSRSPAQNLYLQHHTSHSSRHNQRIRSGDRSINSPTQYSGFTPESPSLSSFQNSQVERNPTTVSLSRSEDKQDIFPTFTGQLTPQICSLVQFDKSRLGGLDREEYIQQQSEAAARIFGTRHTPRQSFQNNPLHKTRRWDPEAKFEAYYEAGSRAIQTQYNQYIEEARLKDDAEHRQVRAAEPVVSEPTAPPITAEARARFEQLSCRILEADRAAQAKVYSEFPLVADESVKDQEEDPRVGSLRAPLWKKRGTLTGRLKKGFKEFLRRKRADKVPAENTQSSKKVPLDLERRLDEIEAILGPERDQLEFFGGSLDGTSNEASYLSAFSINPPAIPEKSPARQALLDQEKRSRQIQSLRHLGSRFDPLPSTTYPAVVDESAVPSTSLENEVQTDPLAIFHSSQLPFSITVTATGDQPTTLPSEAIDSLGDTPAITVSSVSTPPRPSTGEFEEQTLKPFSDNCLSVQGAYPIHLAEMENKLQVRPAEFSSVKTKAAEDARQMQATVIEDARRTGKDPPKYALVELIGKGSFGRVYKGKDMITAAIVAVKIIDIDESDTVNPRNADSYSEFLKEVNALKILSENKARNINHVIEALPVGKAMWMITEYCGGGSIATLMKPTAPGGLQEKWIIPILREVAEAIKWVHQAGIIHRDIKCANVLITEEGGVQLCDFGVAGVIENKVDKRSTVIGTPHWMAPELFGPTPSYGKEVDIWAFGSMVFEIATGLPPNVANGIPYERLGSYLKHNVPRLEGGTYSNDLRNLVAYCLEELPSVRPTIEQVQKHPYIYNTSSRYPASTLSHLVRAFKLWEDHGGSRKSLFMMGGAQGPSESSSSLYDDEWNFSTTAAFDQEISRDANPQDVYEAYGTSVLGFSEETSRPSQQQKASRRRPPPEALGRLPAPLEKIFDPNTLSNYDENSRNHYGRVMPPPTSDLPLRDDTAQTSIRDTMIDLGGHDSETGLSSFPDMDTIKADRRGVRDESEDEYGTLHDFSRPALSDPADINPNRRTQDWKFPTMAPPASADPETSRFPVTYEPPRPAITPASGGRPALVHHPTEPLGGFGGMLGTANNAMERMSMRESLIDLDMSLPDVVPEMTRPSTANSDVESTASTVSEYTSSGNPFELERHASMYQPAPISQGEPAVNIIEDVAARLNPANPLQDMADMSDFSTDIELSRNGHGEVARYDGGSDSDYLSLAPPPARSQALSEPIEVPFPDPRYMASSLDSLPELPPPPSAAALAGTASRKEMKEEVVRQLTGMTDQLAAFKNVYESEHFVNRAGQGARRGGRGGGANGVAQ